MRATRFFQRYLLPGFVFQSVVIGGGYGTGRELAEFFLTYGPIGGLLAMTLISAVIWSAVSAVSFEFARIYQAYDYRGFLKHLLGRAWVLFEISYVALLLIVLAVIAAAAGSMLRETFDLPYVVGVVGIMTAVAYGAGPVCVLVIHEPPEILTPQPSDPRLLRGNAVVVALTVVRQPDRIGPRQPLVRGANDGVWLNGRHVEGHGAHRLRAVHDERGPDLPGSAADGFEIEPHAIRPVDMRQRHHRRACIDGVEDTGPPRIPPRRPVLTAATCTRS